MIGDEPIITDPTLPKGIGPNLDTQLPSLSHSTPMDPIQAPINNQQTATGVRPPNPHQCVAMGNHQFWHQWRPENCFGPSEQFGKLVLPNVLPPQNALI